MEPRCFGTSAKFEIILERIRRIGIVAGDAGLVTVTSGLLVAGVALSQQVGLLTNDALIVALMQANGLTRIASNDDDFDRVPGITRYAPV